MRRIGCDGCDGWAFVSEEHEGPARCEECEGVAIAPAPPPPLTLPSPRPQVPFVRLVGSDGTALIHAGWWLLWAGRLTLWLCVVPYGLAAQGVAAWWLARLGPDQPAAPKPSLIVHGVALGLAAFLILWPTVWLAQEGRRWCQGRLTEVGRVAALCSFHLAAFLPALAAVFGLVAHAAARRGDLSEATAAVLTWGLAGLAVLPAAACWRAGVAAWSVTSRPAARVAWHVLPRPPITWD